jgi:hypothetical protein
MGNLVVYKVPGGRMCIPDRVLAPDNEPMANGHQMGFRALCDSFSSLYFFECGKPIISDNN